MGRVAQSPLIRSFRGRRGAVAAAAPDRRDRLVVAWVWHPGNHPMGGAVTHGRGRARASRRWSWCWAGDHPGAACGPAVSAPVCVPRRGLPRPALAAYLANGLLEEALPAPTGRDCGARSGMPMGVSAGAKRDVVGPAREHSDRGAHAMLGGSSIAIASCPSQLDQREHARSGRQRPLLRLPRGTVRPWEGGQPEGAAVGDAAAQPGVLAGGPGIGRLAGVADP
jgi:hypothetical protein